MEFWLSVPKDDKSQHGSTVEYPHCEAEEVNETLDTAGEDHANGHQGVEEDGGAGVIFLTCTKERTSTR